jgi:hypothetical protein
MLEQIMPVGSGGVLSGRASQSEEDAAYKKVNWHIVSAQPGSSAACPRRVCWIAW